MADGLQQDGSYLLNGQTYSAQQARDYFSSHDAASVARDAASLGMNQNQISDIAAFGGVSNGNVGIINSNISNYVDNSSGAYSWGADGKLRATTPAATGTNNTVDWRAKEAADPGGIWENGRYVGKKEIQAFYASGQDDVQWYQQYGADPGNLATQSSFLGRTRAIDGTNAMKGDAGFKHYFDMYKKEVPDGAFVNDFNGFKNDLISNPLTYLGVTAGTHTGPVWLSTSRDNDNGGVLGPGGSYYVRRPNHAGPYHMDIGTTSPAVGSGRTTVGRTGGNAGGGGSEVANSQMQTPNGYASRTANNVTNPSQQEIQNIYKSMYGRDASPEELAQWKAKFLPWIK